MSLGKRIAELRRQRGLSQLHLADRVHVNRSTLANWETDRADPDTEMLGKLADALGTTVDYLLGRSDLPASAVARNQLYDQYPWLRRLPAVMQIETVEALQGGMLAAKDMRGAVDLNRMDDHSLQVVVRALVEDWQESQRRRKKAQKE